MNRIISFLAKNKEWLFSGLGIFIVLGIISFVRKLIQAHKQKIRFNKTQALKIINKNLPTLILFPPSVPSFPPTPDEIIRAIEQAPILQRLDISKHYTGLKVNWESTLWHAIKISDDCVEVMLRVGTPIISFKLNPKNYPELGLLKEGVFLTVEGTIENIKGVIINRGEARIIKITTGREN
jgi:hypothetical protein